MLSENLAETGGTFRCYGPGTHKQFGHASRRGPKPKTTVLETAGSKLL
jgi:hypothetical protein